MMNRRQALLGVLLAPLIKPVASILPKREVAEWVHFSDIDKMTEIIRSCQVSWREESFDYEGSIAFYDGQTWTDSQVHDLLGESELC